MEAACCLKERKMDRRIIDLHCDTMMRCHAGGHLKELDGHINTEKLRAGGVLAQCFALFISTEPDGSRARGSSLTPYELYQEMLGAYRREMELNEDVIRPALCADDVASNDANGLISSILTVEDGVEIDGKIERIDELYDAGVRMLALTWNYENSIGYPNSPEAAKHSRGLKAFGFEAVTRMNELGMIVDVSHLSEGGFWDVCRNSSRPFAASHSCCRALCGHQRNLTDSQLKAVADKGGIVGMNFYSRFLKDGSDRTDISDIVRHMRHLRDVCGTGAIGWGSDFDGIGCELSFTDCSGFPLILAEMERYFSPDEMEKINSANFLRVWRDNNG